MCGKTEVKQNKFVEYISPAKGYFRETYKSQNIKHISPTPNFTLDIIQIEVKSISKIVSDNDQEIPQSQTADNPVAMRGRAVQPSRDTRKTN